MRTLPSRARRSLEGRDVSGSLVPWRPTLNPRFSTIGERRIGEHNHGTSGGNGHGCSPLSFAGRPATIGAARPPRRSIGRANHDGAESRVAAQLSSDLRGESRYGSACYCADKERRVRFAVDGFAELLIFRTATYCERQRAQKAALIAGRRCRESFDHTRRANANFNSPLSPILRRRETGCLPEHLGEVAGVGIADVIRDRDDTSCRFPEEPAGGVQSKLDLIV